MQRIHDIYRPTEERKLDKALIDRRRSCHWHACGASLVVRALASGKNMPLQ